MLSQKIKIYNRGSDLIILLNDYCIELDQLSRQMDQKAKTWIYRLVDLEKINKILKDSGYEDEQIEFIELQKNSSWQSLDIIPEKAYDIGPPIFKKQKKTQKVKCFSWLKKTQYDDTPMSTQAWKEEVIKEIN